MGAFSWRCKGCGLSVRDSDGANGQGAAWLGIGVALLKNGTRAVGPYSGYGEVGSFDATNHTGEVEMWHSDCYDHAGKPDYTSPSSPARDQGYFSDHWPKTREGASYLAPEDRDPSLFK